MEELIKILRHRFVGYGHYSISIEYNDTEYKTVTTNMQAIDAAFDDDYDSDPDVINGGTFYESQREAQEALINEILHKNDIEL